MHLCIVSATRIVSLKKHSESFPLQLFPINASSLIFLNILFALQQGCIKDLGDPRLTGVRDPSHFFFSGLC